MKKQFLNTYPSALLRMAAITVIAAITAMEMMVTRQALAEDAPKAPTTARAKIYDESLDGSKQIAEALKFAKKDNKRVLLQFGANWCGWCHLMHGLFKKDKVISEKLKADYVVVYIDVNEDHNAETDKKYGNPKRLGLPVIVILDSDGRQLTTKDTANLEEGKGHDPEKVLAFLNEWSPRK